MKRIRARRAPRPADPSWSRRAFVGTSLTALASVLLPSGRVWASDAPETSEMKFGRAPRQGDGRPAARTSAQYSGLAYSGPGVGVGPKEVSEAATTGRGSGGLSRA